MSCCRICRHGERLEQQWLRPRTERRNGFQVPLEHHQQANQDRSRGQVQGDPTLHADAVSIGQA